MIVVTSAPRCGSSLLMQTLVHLGITSVAPAFLKEHERITEYNPGGFYELDIESVEDERFSGMAVKLFGGQLWMTPKHLINKLIWVQRNKRDAVNSYESVRKHLPRTEASSEEIYNANVACIRKSLDEYDGDVFVIKLEEIKARPSLFIADLVKYLQITPSGQQITAACNNINKIK